MNKDSKRQILAQLFAIDNKLVRMYGSAYAKAINLQGVIKIIEAGKDDFSWDDYPDVRKQVEKIMTDLSKNVSALIGSQANNTQDNATKDSEKAIVKSVGGYDTKSLSTGAKTVMDEVTEEHRDKARHTAEKRGLEISKRVWDYNDQSKTEVQIIIQNGIKQGLSADDMTASLKGYLQNPEALFRRVRNKETGELELSSAARDYHPGQGVYRSAYKNALRLARTEVNMAYRQAEWQTYQDNDLVKAYEIRLSNNHTTPDPKTGAPMPLADVCDKLAGIYPKQFKWTGWHPQCRCIMVPITLSPKEFGEYIKAKKEGKLAQWRMKQPAVDMPPQFMQWISDNGYRIRSAIESGKSLPYFIRDNFKSGNIDKGLAFEILSEAQRILQAAQARHEARTQEQIDDIKKRWNEREEMMDAVKKIQEEYSKPYYDGRFSAEIDACSTMADLDAFMTKNGLATSVKFGRMDLEDAKQTCKVLAEMQSRFSLRAIEVKTGGSTRASWYMRANGNHVEINSAYWKSDAIEGTMRKGFYDSVQNYVARKRDTIDKLKKNVEQYEQRLADAKASGDKHTAAFYAKHIKDANKYIKQIQDMLDAGVNRFNQFLSRETMLRDTFAHELGHVVHDQVAGGINGPAFRRLRYDAAEAAKMNAELDSLFKKYKSGDKFVTEYGMSKRNEFMAESMVLYMYRKDKLPQDVADWFERLELMAHGGKLPQGKLSWEEAYKIYQQNNSKEEMIKRAAEKRHADVEHRDKIKAIAQERQRMKGLLNDFEGDETHSEILEEYHKAIENDYDIKSLSETLANAEDIKNKAKNRLRDSLNKLSGVSDLDTDDNRSLLENGKVKDVRMVGDDLMDKIRELSSLDNVENGLENAKKYSYQDVIEADTEIGNLFLVIKSKDLKDQESILIGKIADSVNDMYKDAYKAKLADVRVEIRIENIKPTVAEIEKLAATSSLDKYKEVISDVKKAMFVKDIDEAERLVSIAKKIEPLMKRYDDMMAHKGRGDSIPKALEEARKAIDAFDLDVADAYITKAEVIRKRNEESNARKKAEREAKKIAEESIKKREEDEKIDPNAYIPKTLDELKAEMGSELPKTLDRLDVSISKYLKAGEASDTVGKEEAIESVMSELFEKHDYGMNIRLNTLGLVLDSWFKNTFETGTSGGYVGSSKISGPIEQSHSRLPASHKLFMGGKSTHEQLSRGEYEKYGNLLDHDIERSMNGRNAARGYGEVEVRFKKTKVLATWTAGDSLGCRYQPSLTTDPKACSYDNMSRLYPKKGTQTDDMDAFRSSNISGYLELQYHGKLTVDCVDSVAIPIDIMKDTNARMIADKCVQHGITVYYMKHGELQRYETLEERRKRLLDAANKRHAERDKRLASSGTTKEERIEALLKKRAEMIVEAKKEASIALAEPIPNKDISYDTMKKKYERGDFYGARAEAERIKEQIKKLKEREGAIADLIPDVAERHKEFTIYELESAYYAIKRKIEYIEGRYPGNTKKQLEKFMFEVDYISDPSNQKFSTWSIARDAYKRKSSELAVKVRIEDFNDKIKALRSQTKSKKVKDLLEIAEDYITSGDFDSAEAKIKEAEMAKETIKTRKKDDDRGIGYADEVIFGKNAFSARKKLDAIWKKNESDPQKAFDEIDKIMSKYTEDLWGRLTQEEKHVLYLYTAGSKYINEPFFQEYALTKYSPIDGSKRNSLEDINMLTSIINKAKPLENDMWVQHGEDMSGFTQRFGINLYDVKDIKKIIGTEGINDPFMSTSCAKHSFFTVGDTTRGRSNDVVMSIFLPKGTKGVYCEPFAHFGDGKEIYGAEKGRYGVKGYEWDGKSQQEKGYHASDQVEFLLQRGAKLKITNCEYKGGKWYVECELVGQSALGPVSGSKNRVHDVGR